jgi:heat shock protein HtpX
MKRIFLFVLTNILVMLTISVLINLLGLGRYLTAQGIDYYQLAAFCLVWGMSGSLISLAMSRISARR